MAEYDRADQCSPACLGGKRRGDWFQNWLFTGALSRAVVHTLPLPFLVWFAYENPWQLAEQHMMPILYAIFIALYPPYVSSAIYGWFTVTPLCLGVMGIMTGMSRLIIHLADHTKDADGNYDVEGGGNLFGSGSHRVALATFGIYAAIAIFFSQGRVSPLTRQIYSAVISVNYTYDNMILALYFTLKRGITIFVDGSLAAQVRGLLQALINVELIPATIRHLLEPLVHAECDAMFDGASLVPDQTCRVPVASLLSSSGGLFAGADVTYMNLRSSPPPHTTIPDNDTGFRNLLELHYRPQYKFITNLWVLKGEYGMFRGFLLGGTIAVAVVTLILLLKPSTRSRSAAKQSLIEIQRRLYLHKARLFELAHLVSRSELRDRRIDLVSFSNPHTNANEEYPKFFKGLLKSYDVDEMYERCEDSATFVSGALLETAPTQEVGTLTFPHLKALHQCIAEEAVSTTTMTRQWTGCTETGKPPSDWYQNIGLILANSGEEVVINVNAQLPERTKLLMREAFWCHMRINKLVERLLALDEIIGRNVVVAEIVSEIRQSALLEMQSMISIGLSVEQDKASTHSVALAEFKKCIIYQSILKCKATVRFCEGELRRSYVKFVIGVLAGFLAGLILVFATILKQWASTLGALVTFKRNPRKGLPRSTFINIPSGELFETKEEPVGQAQWKSRERVVKLWHNGELWGGFRHVLGQLIIIGVCLSSPKIMEWWWLDSGHEHRRLKSTLGESSEMFPEIPPLTTPSQTGQGMGDHIVLVDGLVWMDVPLVKWSKMTGWFLLSFYCSYLMTYQGTIKRCFLRLIAMGLGSLSAWCAMLAYQDNIIALTIWGSFHIFIPALLFSYPIYPRLGYDPSWGYFGQILTYHYLVVCFGVVFDPKQSRNELVVDRLMGHVVGSALSLVLALVVFPTSVNAQQRRRLANCTVGLRKNLWALMQVYKGQSSPAGLLQSSSQTGIPVSDASEHHTDDALKEWKKYFASQSRIVDEELQHYNKVVEDGNICSNFWLFRVNRDLLKISSVMKQVRTLRQTHYKVFQELATNSTDWTWKDRELRADETATSLIFEDVGTHTAASPDSSSFHADVSPYRSPGRALVKPHSPQRYYSTLSNRELIVVRKVEGVCERCREQMITDVGPPAAAPGVGAAHESESDSQVSRTPLPVRAEPATAFGESSHTVSTVLVDDGSLADVFRLLDSLWVGVEVALLNKKVPLADWEARMNALLAQAQEVPCEPPMRHMLAVELTCLARIVRYYCDFRQ